MKNKVIIYGKHSCLLAISNPNRICYKLFVSKKTELTKKAAQKKIEIETVTNQQLDQITKNTSHQGVALLAEKTQEKTIEDIIAETKNSQRNTIVMLDGVTDTGNIGSIIRTMACFDAKYLIMPKHGAPNQHSEFSRISSGATEVVSILYATNLQQTLKLLKKHKYWVYCMACEAESTINTIKFAEKNVIILGSEHSGARALTKSESDVLVKIQISENFESLNVSQAASIALYELSRQSV